MNDKVNATHEMVRRAYAVDWFRNEMSKKLTKRIERGDWTARSIEGLNGMMHEEIGELQDELMNPNRDIECLTRIIEECVDVANYAMMQADVARKKIKEMKDENSRISR